MNQENTFPLGDNSDDDAHSIVIELEAHDVSRFEWRVAVPLPAREHLNYTVQAEFEYVAVIARKDEFSGQTGGNFVLVGSDRPIDVAAIGSRLEPKMEVRDQPTDFVGDAPVLTDDYAPVEQLLTPYES